MDLSHPDIKFNKGSDYDVDYDSSLSARKKGGYQWAGGWIDPSVQPSGYKEHPTMSLSESNKRYENARAKARSDQMYIRALEMAEGSAF